MTPLPTTADGGNGRLSWAGYSLGLAIGGFFDGILLHQILQWHHLLAGIRSAPFGDIRVQILADGLFHLLMYLIGAVGLALLLRARHHLSRPQADRLLIANGLIGFGLWHILDSFVSHWITGIHRIRMDSEMPLVWDLIWFTAFGVVPLFIGWMMRPKGPARPQIRRAHAAASFLALTVLLAAPVAALPPRGVSSAVVLFKPGMSPAETMAAVQLVGGRMLWVDRSGALWAIDLDDPADARRLYGRGALLVSNSLVPIGCLPWLRAA